MRRKNSFDKLKSKIITKEAKVGVVGLGYVGLPLAVEMARTGFRVVGTDKRREQLRLAEKFAGDTFKVSRNLDGFEDTEIYIIAVPTPLTKTHDPDLSCVIAAAKGVAKHFGKGRLVVLESTTYPGTTEEVILPILSQNGLRVGEDFFLAFSPERIDPGNRNYEVKNIPKLVGGITPACTELATLFYQQFINQVIPVSSTRVAEMAKLLENVFRSVNVALVNELALLCNRMNINIWEVVKAASTKPFGFMPFYPGPGLGGHCVPIDPFYLSWKARAYDFHTEFIELAGKVNQNMPHYVIERIGEALNKSEKSIKGSKILILGVAYKPDVEDTRESPALRLIELLGEMGAEIYYHDPYVADVEVNGQTYKSSAPRVKLLRESDVTVIVTDHSKIDYKKVFDHSKLIVDTRNALADFEDVKIVRI